MRATPGQAGQRQVVTVPGAHHRDARTGGHVPVEHRPERVARRRPALERAAVARALRRLLASEAGPRLGRNDRIAALLDGL